MNSFMFWVVYDINLTLGACISFPCQQREVLEERVIKLSFKIYTFQDRIIILVNKMFYSKK